MQKIKKFFLALDEHLPCDMFTAVAEELESEKPFVEKLKAFLP